MIDGAVRLTDCVPVPLVVSAVTRVVFSALLSTSAMSPAVPLPAVVRLRLPEVLVFTAVPAPMPAAAFSTRLVALMVPAPPAMLPAVLTSSRWSAALPIAASMVIGPATEVSLTVRPLPAPAPPRLTRLTGSALVSDTVMLPAAALPPLFSVSVPLLPVLTALAPPISPPASSVSAAAVSVPAPPSMSPAEAPSTSVSPPTLRLPPTVRLPAVCTMLMVCTPPPVVRPVN